MTNFKSDFLHTLQTRGYIKQTTHEAELDAYCASGVPMGYIGFDATAESLHVGSLVQIMLLRRLQQAGGKPVVLMGGGTTKVGDPTDKAASRPILSEAEIEKNIAGIKKVFSTFLTFGDGPTDAIMVNNAEWLDKIGYIEFLRDIGKLFTINTMVKQDTVARRLKNEQPYTFLEFNYTLLQAYDFLELSRRYNCMIQLGGSDQWGNIVAGADLIHKADGKTGFGITSHLITTASGGKMGKTADGAVWLNAEMRTPYEYWQFWRNTEDADVGRFLKLFTDLPLDEITRLEALEGAQINDAKIALADAATTMLHGAEAAEAAKASAAKVFEEGGTGGALPTFDLAKSEVEAGMLAAAGFTLAGLTKSNGDARRQTKAGATKINGEAMSDENRVLALSDFDQDGFATLSVGKKRHARLKLVD
ncbi:MAG: tyrosine--tRNA ligase [Ponticaulis sp.]|nr:tyrosine--tRNA ligase [Ponticaulis sp.]|tara:strand:- start:28854 stop:30110 length:1257 start_codon:yes stop_codon:yes gene_type:complete